MKCPKCGNDDLDNAIMVHEPIEDDKRRLIGYRLIGMRCGKCRALLKMTVGAIEEIEIDGPAAV